MDAALLGLEETLSREQFEMITNILKESALDLSAFATEVQGAIVFCMIQTLNFGIIEGMHEQRKIYRSQRRKELRKIKNENKNGD